MSFINIKGLDQVFYTNGWEDIYFLCHSLSADLTPEPVLFKFSRTRNRMQPPETSQPTKAEQGPQRKRKIENNEMETRESIQAQLGSVPGSRRQRKGKRISKTPEEVDKSVQLIINECKSFVKAFINLDNIVKPLRKKLTTKENEFMDALKEYQVAFKNYTAVLLNKEELDDTMREKIISVLKKCDIDNESDLLVDTKFSVSPKALETFAEKNKKKYGGDQAKYGS